jgi:hypothetical protein
MTLTYHENHGPDLVGKPVGPVLFVLGKESPPVREVILEAERASMARGGRLATSDVSRETSIKLARVAVVGWEDWSWQGKVDVPFSRSLWNEIMDDAANFWWLAEQVDRFVQRGSGYFMSPSET